ncbi:MAG: DUF6318 family protein [Actinomycetaceae bacterium]|nr:DUF6318 family protein [Actinomycetaceae bacterium]
MRTFFKIAAGLALPALVLAGCSDAEAEAEPEATYPSQSATELNESPTEEPTTALVPPTKEELYPYPVPELPDAAKQRTKQGAEAFSVYFMEVLGYSMATLEPEALRGVCTETSEFCDYFAKVIEGAAETESYFDGYDIRGLEATGSLQGGSTDRVEWGTQVIGYVTEHYGHVARDSEIRKFEEFHFVAAVEVMWDDGWKVEEAQAVPYEEVYDD